MSFKSSGMTTWGHSSQVMCTKQLAKGHLIVTTVAVMSGVWALAGSEITLRGYNDGKLQKDSAKMCGKITVRRRELVKDCAGLLRCSPN